VPRHVARLVTQLVVDFSASRRLVVDSSASRRLIIDYFASTARPVPRHVARLVTRLVTPLVVDYSASRRLVIDYFTFAARPGASVRRAAHHAARRAARHRLLRLAQARRRLLRLLRASGCLGTSRGSSCGSSRRSSSTTPPRAGSSSTTSPSSRIRVRRYVVRLVTWLVVPLVVDYSALLSLVVDYAVRRDCLSRGNTGSTSSKPCAATTSSSGRIVSTIHLD
jgi:hypothetical protein